jgi:hypothetical protein
MVKCLSLWVGIAICVLGIALGVFLFYQNAKLAALSEKLLALETGVLQNEKRA